jgi:uncharacterized protein YneF (UPF0154 family)
MKKIISKIIKDNPGLSNDSLIQLIMIETKGKADIKIIKKILNI